MPEHRLQRTRALYPPGWVYQPPRAEPIHGGTWDARYKQITGELTEAEADRLVRVRRALRKDLRRASRRRVT